MANWQRPQVQRQALPQHASERIAHMRGAQGQARFFTSDLSGQDFWMLLRSGFRPVSLVMGNCVYHVAHQTLGGWFKSVGQNMEMPNFTQALYDARELAMERLQYEAQIDGAAGVVGTEVHESTHGWDAHVIEFFAIGTSVLPIHASDPPPTPDLVMTVNE